MIDLKTLREQLSAHLSVITDPCQDRGVDWPCDVAEVLNEAEYQRIRREHDRRKETDDADV